MPGRHVLIKALDSISPREFAELLVHVVGPRARVVPQPDAEVFDLQRLLFVDLGIEGRHNQSAIPFRLPLEGCKGHLQIIRTIVTPMISPLAFLTFFSCLENLSYAHHEEDKNTPEKIPEARLCDNIVGSENAHAVDFGSRIRLCGQMTSNNLVLVKAHFI